MAEITLSNAVRSNLLSLKSTVDLMSKTQQRLSTGLKVNSALDDPTAFFTASSLNSRAGDLNRLLDSVSGAVQTVKAADDGISAITKLVESAQATARQALQKPIGSGTTVSLTGTTAIGADVAATTTGTQTLTGSDTLVGDLGFTDGETISIDIGGTTTSVTLASGAATITGTVSGLSPGDLLRDLGWGDFDTFELQVGGSSAIWVGGLQAAISDMISFFDATLPTAEITFNADGQIVITANNNTDSITLTEGPTGTNNLPMIGFTPTTVNPTAGTTVNDLVSALDANANGSVTLSGGNIVATADNNTDSITFGGTASGDFATLGIDTTIIDPTNVQIAAMTDMLSITDGAGAAETIDMSSIYTRAALESALDALSVSASIDADDFLSIEASSSQNDVTISGGTDFGLSDETTFAAFSTERNALQTEFNSLRTQIDQLVGDASYNGVNLLNGDSLSVIFNEDGTSSLSVTGVTFDSSGLGFSAAATDAFQTNASIDTSLAELDTAISSLRSQASTFGSNLSVVEMRQDFAKNLINTLETGAANLILADTNQEGTNMLALQTRQQLSSVALSIASQADQQVLSLF